MSDGEHIASDNVDLYSASQSLHCHLSSLECTLVHCTLSPTSHKSQAIDGVQVYCAKSWNIITQYHINSIFSRWTNKKHQLHNYFKTWTSRIFVAELWDGKMWYEISFLKVNFCYLFVSSLLFPYKMSNPVFSWSEQNFATQFWSWFENSFRYWFFRS